MRREGQDIRTSQALYTYAPGSIADFPGLSLMILSHDVPQDETPLSKDKAKVWGEDKDKIPNKLEDVRLQLAFDVEFFVSPPKNDSIKACVQAIRFPTIQRCDKCSRLWDTFMLEKDQNLYTDRSEREIARTYDETFSAYRCPNCKKDNLLKPVRFVIATEDGHIDDFPFDWYLHTQRNKPEEIGKHNLFLYYTGASASLKDIKIQSKTNDGKNVCSITLERIFENETFVNIKDETKDYLKYVNGRMPKPWQGKRSDDNDQFKSYLIDDFNWPPYNESADEEEKKNSIKKYPRTLQRGAGNLYFPIVYKGITLPKSSSKSDVPEDFTYAYNKFKNKLIEVMNDEEYDVVNHLETKTFKNDETLWEGYTKKQTLNYIRLINSKNEDSLIKYTINQLREQEYDCFLKDNLKVNKDEWYDSKILNGNEYNFCNKKIVQKVVLLNKLRELKIFKGFTRIKPLMFEDLILESKEGLTGRKKQEFARIQDPRSDIKTNTLPATEVKGEGIFIEFNSRELLEWERNPKVKERFNIIFKNYNNYNSAFGIEEEDSGFLSARYVAIHTFCHLLINQLSIECGYGSSSLSEIIYCSSSKSKNLMNGILIYTSTSDSEGTLGGLVEKGSSAFLNSIVEKALAQAKWCSSDPLCIDEKIGKGFMGVNLASCHSCSLISETSCCNMNKFLDRGLVIGTLDNPEIGLFI